MITVVISKNTGRGISVFIRLNDVYLVGSGLHDRIGTFSFNKWRL